MKLSVVICTFNSEEKIAACLKSVAFADEIVVVDDGSSDETLDIVGKYTKKIFHHKSVGYVEPVRNFALEKATNEWILLLDADETVPDALAKKIIELLPTLDESIVALFVPRKNIIFQKWVQHAGWWPDQQVRIFRKGKVVWQNKIADTSYETGTIIKYVNESDKQRFMNFVFEQMSRLMGVSSNPMVH